MVLDLVMWQAMRYTVILFRSTLQGIVRLRMCEQCWQSIVEPQLAGKLFHQGVEAEHTAGAYQVRGCSDRFSAHLMFFLWGFVKNQVYRTPVRDLADLQERIYAVVNIVIPQMLLNTSVEVEYRMDISHATNGSHVEVCGT